MNKSHKVKIGYKVYEWSEYLKRYVCIHGYKVNSKKEGKTNVTKENK